MSWICGRRASESLPLGCRAVMLAGPRMLARRLFSGGETARRGGQRGRDRPGHPTTSCDPTSSTHTRVAQTHAAQGQVHAEPAPQPHPGHTGTPVTPLQAPDDKLLHGAYCNGDGEG